MKNIKSIGVIIDGNRRWAVKNNLPKTGGHKFGVKKVLKTIE
jgi:undecaprenyl diphosphate synthase